MKQKYKNFMESHKIYFTSELYFYSFIGTENNSRSFNILINLYRYYTSNFNLNRIMQLSDETIKILPDYLTNQIAAGEVVQRPESVIKELVENSLDSGADSIAIIVRGAGKTLLHVVDNGKGMSRMDLMLAPQRHATSKIKTSEDLERIMSFGFRGEALASISAVASMEIRTKRASDEHGWSLVTEPMKVPEISPIDCDNGTQVLVRNLFYNVPARKKFLKSDLTEFRYISDTVIRLAISHYDKRFTFYDNETMIFDVHKETQQERIRNIIGKTVEGGLLPLEFIDEKIQIQGYIGLPHLAKSSASNQYLFLNKRMIQSKNLSYAVYSAFEHLLEKNHKPLFVINLDVDPERVDVNIHPQKNEVKFDDDRYIYNSVRHAVANTLKKHNLTPEHRLASQESRSPFFKMNLQQPEGAENVLVNKLTGEIIDPHNDGFNHSNRPNYSDSFRGKSNWSGNNSNWMNVKSEESSFGKASAFDVLFGKNETQSFDGIHPATNRIEIPRDAEFFQIHNKYILMQSPTGILIIDQHNAHERIIYEKAIKSMNRELANSQALVFPIATKISPAQIAVAREIDSEMLGLGYDFKLQDDGSLEITAVPLDIPEGLAANSFLEILDEYAENRKISHSAARENLAATYSCKLAIKTGKKLIPEEMASLAKNLMQCSMPYVCPHGRPIILEISLGDLDKSFKRS